MSTTFVNNLERLLDPVSRSFTVESAQTLAGLRADGAFQARLDELADRNTEGKLTPEDREEYDLYLAALSVLSILQSKARRHLEAANGAN